MPIKVVHAPDLNLVGAAAYSAGAGQRAERDLERQQRERMQMRSIQASQLQQESQNAARERQMMLGHGLDQAANQARFGQQVAMNQMEGAQRGALMEQDQTNKLEYLSQSGEQGLAAQEAMGERQAALEELDYQNRLDLDHRKQMANWLPGDQRQGHALLAKRRAIMGDSDTDPQTKAGLISQIDNEYSALQEEAANNANPPLDSEAAFSRRMPGAAFGNKVIDHQGNVKLDPEYEFEKKLASTRAQKEEESDAKFKAEFNKAVNTFATTQITEVQGSGEDVKEVKRLPTRDEILQHAENLKAAREIAMQVVGGEKQLAEVGEMPAPPPPPPPGTPTSFETDEQGNPIVQNLEDVQWLQPGSTFVAPDGKLKVVP